MDKAKIAGGAATDLRDNRRTAQKPPHAARPAASLRRTASALSWAAWHYLTGPRAIVARVVEYFYGPTLPPGFAFGKGRIEARKTYPRPRAGTLPRTQLAAEAYVPLVASRHLPRERSAIRPERPRGA